MTNQSKRLSQASFHPKLLIFGDPNVELNKYEARAKRAELMQELEGEDNKTEKSIDDLIREAEQEQEGLEEINENVIIKEFQENQDVVIGVSKSTEIGTDLAEFYSKNMSV